EEYKREFRLVIEDCVQRHNAILTDSFHFLSIFVLHCIENKIALPKIDGNFIYTLSSLTAISSWTNASNMRKSRTSDGNEFREAHKLLYDVFDLYWKKPPTSNKFIENSVTNYTRTTIETACKNNVS